MRAINGAANKVTWIFDALGRVTSEANVLGTFTYTYDGVTSRLATVTYPNDQTSIYSYLPNSQDHRLQTIHHKYPNATTLSKFDYTYDTVGNILTWRQQADTTAVNWRYGYDPADQLTSAIKDSTDPLPVIQKRYAYGYDPAGNRLFEQIDDQVMAASHDNLNRLTQHTPGGPLRFVGTVNEPANVTVAGQPAMVDPTNTFRGPAPTISGTTTVSITATDPSGNVASRQYEVDVTGAPKTFTYDANGNMTFDGTRTFEWDARDQLVSVTAGTHRTEFTNDGLQRRLRVVEKESGLTQSAQLTVWCGSEVCEERTEVGSLATRLAFTLGEQVGGVTQFFAPDHLRSNHAVTSGAAILTARYSFNPWGRRPIESGTDVTAVGFTAHRWHSASAAWLSAYRVVDSESGRWLREDPLERLLNQPGGMLTAGRDPGIQTIGARRGLIQLRQTNLYSYVENRPTVLRDPLGLWSMNDTCKVGLCRPARRVRRGLCAVRDFRRHVYLYDLLRRGI